MAAFNKFDIFVADLSDGFHDGCMTADTDAIHIYLSNAVPSTSADAVKADLAEITQQNGYDNTQDTTNLNSQTTGTITIAATDIVITATGTVGPFQYVVLFNDTQSTPLKPLIGWWDHGSAVTLANTETFTIDFGSNTLFTLA